MPPEQNQEQTETTSTETKTEEKTEESLVTDPPKTEEESETKTEEEGKTEEVKDGEKEGGDEPEPLTAESVTIPEGLEVDDKSMGKFLDVMNDKDLSPQERAQALVDLQADVVKEASEKNAELWQQTQEEWVTEVKSDTEIGGEKLQPALDRIGQVLDQYGNDDLRNVIRLTGVGNNVHMVKFLDKIAKELTEGGSVSGSPGTSGRSPAEILYPNQGKE